MANKESSFEPPADLLATTKRVTWNYYKEHYQRCFAVKNLTIWQQSNLRALCRLFWGFVMCTSAASWI